MAANSKRAGPRKGGPGDNSLTAKEESALIKRVLSNMTEHKLRDDAFKAKQKRNWEKDVVSHAKALGFSMAALKEYFADHTIETGKDEDAVQKAMNRRAARLDTTARLYAAMHDGEQLDLLKMHEQARKAREEAEKDAGEAIEKEDDDNSD